MPTITANIAPNIRTTQTANFQFMIVLTIMGELDRSSFSLANVIVSAPGVTAVAGSGTDHTYNIGDGRTVALSLSSDGEGGNFAIDVSGLPSEMSGSFTVGVTGNVMVDSASDMLSGAAKTINYDTLTSLGASFGTVEYRDGGVIAIPVTFAFDVIAPSKTIFDITRVSGDDIEDFEYYIVGQDTAYELIMVLPVGLKGRVSVGVSGTVFKEFSGTYDTVSATAIEFNYNMKLPTFSVEIPPRLQGGINDFFYDFEELVFNFDSSKISVLGSNLTPSIYRAVATDTRPAAARTLSSSDWVLAADAHTEHARFYLFRFDVPSSAVRGGLNILWNAGAIQTVPDMI